MFKQNRKKLVGRKMDKGAKNAWKTSGFCPDFPPGYEIWTLSLTSPNLCSQLRIYMHLLPTVTVCLHMLAVI